MPGRLQGLDQPGFVVADPVVDQLRDQDFVHQPERGDLPVEIVPVQNELPEIRAPRIEFQGLQIRRYPVLRQVVQPGEIGGRRLAGLNGVRPHMANRQIGEHIPAERRTDPGRAGMAQHRRGGIAEPDQIPARTLQPAGEMPGFPVALRQVPELRSRAVAPCPFQQVPVQQIGASEARGLLRRLEPQLLERGGDRVAIQKSIEAHRPRLPAARTPFPGEPSTHVAAASFPRHRRRSGPCRNGAHAWTGDRCACPDIGDPGVVAPAPAVRAALPRDPPAIPGRQSVRTMSKMRMAGKVRQRMCPPPRRAESCALWRSGALALWRSGALALWRSGALALWRSGALALWRSGALALWRSGALALWRSGAMALWRSIVSSGRFRTVNLFPYSAAMGAPPDRQRAIQRAMHRAAAARGAEPARIVPFFRRMSVKCACEYRAS